VAFVTQFDDDLGTFLRHSLGMALRAFRAILETGETFLSINRPPLVKGLTADAKLLAYPAYVTCLVIPPKPR
jgi:hypothetical protein